MRTLLVIDDFQPLFSHYAPYDLLKDVCTFSFEPGVYGSVAPAPLAFSKHRSHLCPESFILVLTQTATVVLIGALRYLQESDDQAEGQPCRLPQSLAEPELAPVRDQSRVPPDCF